MRMCVEQGLHKKRASKANLLDEQLRRRVFWICYVMDRYSSYTLNRPLAITDQEIQISMPIHADDCGIIAASELGLDLDTFFQTHGASSPNEMTVALCCIRLRQISSRIHTQTSQLLRACSSALSQQETFLASGRVHAMIDNFIGELKTWRTSAPSFDNPRCLYERQEWFDLLEAREKLLLVRKAVDLAPKRNGVPSHDMLMLCLQCAIRTILLYADLFRGSMITCTRSYFQTMFAAGLSILFCISVSADLRTPHIKEGRRALLECEETLKQMAAQLPDASPYATVFEVMHRLVLEKLHHIEASGLSAPASPKPVDLTSHPPTDKVRRGGILDHHWASEPSYPAFGVSSEEEAYGVGQLYDGQEDSELLLGIADSLGTETLRWPALECDTLWTMGNYTYADPQDAQGILGVTNFNF